MSWLSNLLTWLESLLRDARFGARMLRKDTGVTVTAVFSLSLAIGACASAFSLIDALMLRPLPVPQPQQLIELAYPAMRVPPGAPPDRFEFSYPELASFRALAGAQADLFGATVWGPPYRLLLEGATTPEQVRAQWISDTGLGILGVRPALGRLFTRADDQRDQKQSVAVISYAFWMRRFAGNPAALGRVFTLNDTEFRIVGVTQEGFTGLEPGVLNDVWLPLTLLNNTRNRFAVLGRLRPGVDATSAQYALQAVFTSLRREEADDPDSRVPPEQLERFVSARLKVNSAAQGHTSFLRWQFERPLWILAVVVGLVLLVACSNVANLLLARAAARSHEMIMRVALGAGRLRLIQQVLIECGLLSAIACVVGLGIAAWTAPALVMLMGTVDDPAYLAVEPDWRMLAFLAIVCLATTSLFGLAPALRASAANSTSALKEVDSRQSARTGLLRTVLATQVAFSFMVLFVAGLLLLSFHRLTSLDLGFSQKNVLLFNLDSRARGHAKERALQAALLDRLHHLPEVEAASTSGIALMGGATSPTMSAPIRVAGRIAERNRPLFFSVSPGFFSAMQIPLQGGRDFTARDAEPDVPHAVIVNQFFARQFFPGQNPVGQRFERVVDDEGHWAGQEIVGVVGDAKYNNLREPTAPTIYFPAAGVGGVVEVRTRHASAALAPAIRRAIQEVDPALTVLSVTSQSTRIDDSILQERMLALLGGFFALIAVVLAAVGLHGVLSYSVLRRTREIGVRVALGASLGEVVRMVTADIAVTVAIGLAAGLAGGIALSRIVASTLFEVKPSDFWSVALPLLFLLAACGLSALPTALRAGRVDPAEALRQQ